MFALQKDNRKFTIQTPETTKRVFYVLVFTLACLLLLLTFSFIGTGTNWICELDSEEPRHDYICKELSKAVGCGNISGPIHAEIMLDIGNQVKASACIVCPWETAISEIRFCFAILATASTVIGLFGLVNESRKQVDLQNSTGPFLAMLLLISSSFDLLAISTSSAENNNFCSLSDEFTVGEGVEGEKMECTYFQFYITALMGFVSGLSLLWSSVVLRMWKSGLALDGL